MSDQYVVPRLAGFEAIEKSRHVEVCWNRHCYSPISLKSQVADTVLNWDQLDSSIRYKVAVPTLTNCIACGIFDHIDKIRRCTRLVPQFDLCNLTTTFAGKASFTL